VRKDFPGGFPGDSHNAFTKEGRTQEENAMFNWLSRLLHWRQGNETIIKGEMTQFIPYKGVYVVARQYRNNTVLTIINGRKQSGTLEIARYQEVIGNKKEATDVITGKKINLSENVVLQPRQTLIVEIN
jgi:glycosidase